MNRIDTDSGMSIYQFTGRTFDANSFVIVEGNEVLIIDAVDSSDMVSFLLGRYEGEDANGMSSELWMPTRRTADGVTPELTILLTHEHFDHISGLTALRDRFRCHVVSSGDCSARIQSPQTNLSSVGDVLLAMQSGGMQQEPYGAIPRYGADAADEVFIRDSVIVWRGHDIFCHLMRGHSLGSAVYILDGGILFSGDEILPIPTLTRLPGGNTKAFWYEDMPWLESLREQISLVCPGHGMPGKLGDMISGNAIPAKYKDKGEKANAQAGHL